MRFPLRRNHVDDRLAILRLPVERDAPGASVPETARLADQLDDIEREPAAARGIALPVLTFADGRVTPGIAVVDSIPETPTEPPREAPPALPFALPLKGQFTAADSRADRLVRQVRGEVDELRKTLGDLVLERDDMIGVDAQAVVANPEAAASLPPAVLVGAIVTATQRAAGLEEQLARESKKSSKLRARLRAARLEAAARSARLDTLEEVIAVLHGNLEDLRGERDHERRIDAPAAPHAIRPAIEMPTAFPSLVDRD